MSFGPDKLITALRGLPAAQCYWAGFSGGLDSTVLVRALAQQKPQLGAELHAVHVNHHLSPQSNDWQRHCQQVCAALQVPLECRSVTVGPVKGESLEAVAREQRYGVFRELMQKGDMLLLAQHCDDQMETFLLQALRGAGLRGLAAMPVLTALGHGYLARPLLAFTRDELHAWAGTQRLAWLEDPSNADVRFDRNYLRRQVIPLVRSRWPSAAETMTRSARHCAEALELLAAVAEEDWSRCADSEGRMLTVAALRGLGKPRAKNLLRYWLERLALPVPPARKLEQIFSEVLPARADRNPCVSWEGAEVHRYRSRLYGLPSFPEASMDEFRLQPGGQQMLGLDLGTLRLVPTTGEGIRATDCPQEGLRVSFRVGGEVCQPEGRTHRRPLKKWLQEFGVVPWMRERVPLIYIGDELAAVAGMFVSAPFAAGKDEPGLRVEWLSHPQLH